MAELQHVIKQSQTGVTLLGTAPSTTLTVISDLTITWTDLTNAGFQAGDNVVVLLLAAPACSNGNTNITINVGFGSSSPGTVDSTSTSIEEAPSSVTNRSNTMSWLDKRALVSGENIYVRWQASAANDLYLRDAALCVFNADDLGSYILYDEQTHSGNAPTSYDTSGASITTNAAGNWWFVVNSRWLCDSATTGDTYSTAVQIDGTDYGEVTREGEDAADEPTQITSRALNLASSSIVARARYKVATTSTHDCVRTAILGINLAAFANSTFKSANPASSLTGAGTWDIEMDGDWNPSFTLTSTGKVFAFATAAISASGGNLYVGSRVTLSNTVWPNASAVDNNTTSHGAETLNTWAVGYGTVSSGTPDIDFDVRSGTVGMTLERYSGVIFSLELAGGGTNISGSPGTIAATGQTASISSAKNVAGTPGTIVVTGLQATVTVSSSSDITGSPGTILVTGQTASVAAETAITGTPGTIVVTGATADISNELTITGSPGTIAVTGTTATLTYSVRTEVTGSVAVVVVSGQQATITATTSTLITGTAATITVTGQEATISTGQQWGRRLRGRRTRLPVYDEETGHATVEGVVPQPLPESTLAEVIPFAKPFVRVPAKKIGRPPTKPRPDRPFAIKGKAAVVDLKKVRIEVQQDEIAMLKAELVALAKRVTTLESFIEPDDDEDEAIIMALLQRRA